MKDLHSSITSVALIVAALDADNTPAPIDLQGYGSAELLIGVGVGGVSFSDTNKIEFKLTHADDKADGSAPDAADFVPVTDKDVLGVPAVGAGGIVKALTAAHPETSVYRVGYKGNRRWIKILADFSGTHGTATALGVYLVKGHGADNPQPDQI